jgi:hypothetical protein
MNFSRNTKYRATQIAKHERNEVTREKRRKRKKEKASSKDGPKGNSNE